MSRNCASVLRRSVMSRIVLMANDSPSLASGLRLISTGILWPSRCRPNKFQAGTHRPDVRVGKKLFAMFWMPGPITLRNQNLDGLSDQFLPAVAKELFRLSVGQEYEAIAIDDYQSIGQGLHQSLELFDLGNAGVAKTLDLGRLARQGDQNVGLRKTQRIRATGGTHRHRTGQLLQ